ncbi:cbb3-type cytochrome c oxidase N-terminal domain-containing protein [Chitinophaga caseinilytica]|uniref:Cbb3-type cytochrome c oxidase N-terminal domain-containing protein n=1 Tax=Chitinophaga caseinilytica TaxID=2267521 RepID=A0ABZ2ZAB3_9BACT
MKRILTFLLTIFTLQAFAAGAPPDPYGELTHPVAILLITIAFGLLIAIIVLGNTVISAIDIFRDRMKKLPLVLLLLAAGHGAFAQEAEAAVEKVSQPVVAGLSDTTFYMLLTVVGLEILVLLFLLQALRILTGITRKKKEKVAKAAVPGKPRITWMERLNKTRSLDAESEEEVDLGHDYDGIRELNNPTPPWWRWAFYLSIVFGVIYIWRYHISETAPLQLQELAIADAKAAEAKAAYLKNSANNIDENNVKLLTEAADIGAGQKMFATNCAACHGPEGQGLVGPNLTDKFWLHGGKVNEVFSTIKYGVPDKGMKSWKDDFSPKQIAQLCAYIHSIKGTTPANPKAPEGAEVTE